MVVRDVAMAGDDDPVIQNLVQQSGEPSKAIGSRRQRGSADAGDIEANDPHRGVDFVDEGLQRFQACTDPYASRSGDRAGSPTRTDVGMFRRPAMMMPINSLAIDGSPERARQPHKHSR